MMGKSIKWNKAAGLVLFMFSCGFAQVVKADFIDDAFGIKVDDFVKSRSYIGGFGTSTNIDTSRDINGTSGFVGQTFSDHFLSLLPSIDRSFGFGVLLGHREGPWAAEASYWYTNHNASWSNPNIIAGTFNGTANYQSINLDFKRYLFTSLPTQPFFGIGVSFPWVVYQNASTDTLGDFSEESIAGVGFNLSVGLEIYVGDGFSLVGAAQKRWSGFNTQTGIDRQPSSIFNPIYPGTTDITYEGDGFNFYAGGTFGFE